jgi:uncharacterized membrane protein YkoI
MKIKTAICFALAVGLLAGCASEKHEKCEKHAHKHSSKEAKLMAEAKISKADAEKTALTKVPNGTVKEAELEREKGKLIWSFGFTTPDSKDITEVNVDAITGDIVNVEHESAKSESKEATEENDND